MGKRFWIGEALRLHFDEKLTRLAVSHHLKLSDSTLYDFFQRFRKYNLPWPLPNGVTMDRLERILYPGKRLKKRAPVGPVAATESDVQTSPLSSNATLLNNPCNRA